MEMKIKLLNKALYIIPIVYLRSYFHINHWFTINYFLDHQLGHFFLSVLIQDLISTYSFIIHFHGFNFNNDQFFLKSNLSTLIL